MIHSPHRRGQSKGGRGVLSYAADWVWPPRSLLSEAIVERPGVMREDEWMRLSFLTGPCCDLCGAPFETIEAAGARCGACLARAPRFDQARAALRYDEHSRALVLDLKHGGRRDGLTVFASWMANAAAAQIAKADVIAPTPLHWTRLFERKFNQSAWLAQALGTQTGKPVALALLRRRRRRRSQEGLSARERRRNVAGVMRANRTAAGKSVLLVDDVFTTGATANACARALKQAGARKVAVVTLARVVRPLEVSISA